MSILSLKTVANGTYACALADERFAVRFTLCGDAAFSLQTGGRDFFRFVASGGAPTVSLWTQYERPFVLDGCEDGRFDRYRITYDGIRFRVYINGALFDEEWIFGTVPLENPRLVVEDGRGLREWSLAAFSDDTDDIPDPAAVAAFYPAPVGAYFAPTGHKEIAGDCLPFFRDGVYYLYYLTGRRAHASMHGRGGHQWALRTTRDLVHWQDHGIVLGIDSKDPSTLSCGSICTGSVVYRDGKYYAYYATRKPDPWTEEITYAVGDTPYRFQKTAKPVFAFPMPPYDGASGRDPFPFEVDGKAYMLVTKWRTDRGNKGGCLTLLESDDWENWRLTDDYFPGYNDCPECCETFRLGKRWYLVFSNEGVARYRIGDGPTGPWHKPAGNDAFEAQSLRVMKSAAFTGGRRIGAGFLCAQGYDYGGTLLLREIFVSPDGTLSTRFVPEIIDALPKTPRQSGSLRVTANGFVTKDAGKLPRDFLLQARLETSGGQGRVGISFRNGGAYADGTELCLDFERGCAEIRASAAPYCAENNARTIYGVGGKTHDVRLFVQNDLVDVEIDGRRTLCSRVPRAASEHDALFFFAHDNGADVTFTVSEV